MHEMGLLEPALGPQERAALELLESVPKGKRDVEFFASEEEPHQKMMHAVDLPSTEASTSEVVKGVLHQGHKNYSIQQQSNRVRNYSADTTRLWICLYKER